MRLTKIDRLLVGYSYDYFCDRLLDYVGGPEYCTTSSHSERPLNATSHGLGFLCASAQLEMKSLLNASPRPAGSRINGIINHSGVSHHQRVVGPGQSTS